MFRRRGHRFADKDMRKRIQEVAGDYFRPVAGVAIGDGGAGRHLRGDPGELGAGPQPVGRRIVRTMRGRDWMAWPMWP